MRHTITILCLLACFVARAQRLILFPRIDAMDVPEKFEYCYNGRDNNIYIDAEYDTVYSFTTTNGIIKQVLPDTNESYFPSYNLIPSHRGKTTAKVILGYKGKKDTLSITVKAINRPDIALKIIYDSLQSKGKYDYAIVNKATGKPLPKRYSTVGIPETIIKDSLGNEITSFPFNDYYYFTETETGEKVYPGPNPIKNGHILLLHLQGYDSKTKLLVPIEKLVYTIGSIK